MSTPEAIPVDVPVVVETPPRRGSLAARITERREKLESITSELFNVPGFEGVMKVELRLLGGKRLYNLATANERRDEFFKRLFTAADAVVNATVGLYEVSVDAEGNEHTKLEEGLTWKDVAHLYDKTIDAATIKHRDALIHVLSDVGVMKLAGEWDNWQATRGQKSDQALVRD